MSIPPANPLINDPPEWLAKGAPHLWLPYTQMQTTPMALPIAKTDGVRLTLADGRELIDGVSSWWTAAHGYNHPHIRAAVTDQLEKMPHVMLGGLAHEPACRLATRLSEKLPGDLGHVFFSESGSVSVEIAMKIAVQYGINKGKKGRTRFVSFKGGYHGDTLATMSVCDPDEGMHTLFKGAIAEQFICELPNDAEKEAALDAFLGEHGHEVAAVVTEPLVQGAGGMRFHTPETLRKLRALCDKHDVLLILDEIFTGFGRTGSMFACEQAGIVPDIVTLSKALTGGTMALAATIATARVFEAFLGEDAGKALMHGPTYTGNPLACAAANASLDLFEREPRLDQVAAISAQLTRELEPARTLPGVKDVRVMGAIGVIEVEAIRDADAIKRRFVEEGVWIRPFGNIIYTTPPLIIGSGDLARLTGAMVKITAEMAGE
ncbi:adenosylmethionine--8-amino-7-oxononanoate transaminase [Parvibaculum sp.]|jgi:adenosylmethionine---8-amino-7-oxononanoate aminotransferase|uniref:adenosylmethionine--8-amino-7-oxononanoate transaminase n=1 Tax=Parvibaculum sp. TaxID=2024848 RepID=UPI000C3E2C94|nr:adenosylmethionine--8-amino-7-oxononanoate transaminase [Parvibaculum sp.]MAM94557.1 adenosylmethionine--8-amino-7-oxononanoate transaminase [Parvibaculum sp.]|tara:strand:- start:17645 stop:18946 length:1302 start_codon:yes stop_codon:yes gene_type:complete